MANCYDSIRSLDPVELDRTIKELEDQLAAWKTLRAIRRIVVRNPSKETLALLPPAPSPDELNGKSVVVQREVPAPERITFPKPEPVEVQRTHKFASRPNRKSKYATTVLEYLEANGGAHRAKELSETLHINYSTLFYVLKRLEELKQVKQLADFHWCLPSYEGEPKTRGGHDPIDNSPPAIYVPTSQVDKSPAPPLNPAPIGNVYWIQSRDYTEAKECSGCDAKLSRELVCVLPTGFVYCRPCARRAGYTPSPVELARRA